MLSIRLVWGVCLLAAGLAAAPAAAASYVLTVDDAVTMPGTKTLLTAWLQRGSSLAFKDDIKGAEIQFFVDDRLVGRAITDKEGSVKILVDFPSSRALSVKAVAHYKSRRISSRGRLYHWSRERTIIAVDVDDCISRTSYSDLFLTHFDANSKPLEGSREVLRRLAKDYQLLYISARPRFLTQKTWRWLTDQGFPAGPYYHAKGFDACLHQGTAKREILADLVERWPNLLIGIGDKGADERAFGAHDMLTLLVNAPKFSKYKPHCLVLKDWREVGNFFENHRRKLAQPATLHALMAGANKNFAPLFASPDVIEQPNIALVKAPPERPAAPAEPKISLVKPSIRGEPAGPQHTN